MKTTLEIPDELFRAAKSKAALEGRRLRDLVEDGLRYVVTQEPATREIRRTQFPLISAKSHRRKLTTQAVTKVLRQMEDDEVQRYAHAVRR
jgi:hypothetical protein